MKPETFTGEHRLGTESPAESSVSHLADVLGEESVSMKKLAVAVLAALTLTVAGCSAGDAQSGAEPSANSGELIPVKVGAVPVAEFATLFVALDEGYFEDEGLDVTVEVMPSAASIAPAVMNGQLQLGTASLPPLITAVAQGLPLRAVANSSDVPSDGADDISAVLVRPDKGIETPSDLEGKIVAVNALQAVLALAVMQLVEDDGGNPSAVTFVAMPLPDMAGALERGDVDAAAVSEPFLTLGVESGATVLSPLFSEVFLPGTAGVYFASDDYIASSSDAIEKFRTAITRAAEAATDDPQLVRDALVTHGGLDPAVAERMMITAYSGELSVDAVDRVIEIMVEQGFLTDAPPTGADVVAQ